MNRKSDRKIHWITDAKQVRAITTPMRNRIHLALQSLGKATVGDLADHLGRSPESLYYHIRALQKVGLVKQVGTRVNNGRRESVFAMCAAKVRVDTRIANRIFRQALVRGAKTLFRFAERSYRHAMQSSKTVLRGQFRETRLIQVTARLDRQHMIELNRKIIDLENFVLAADDEKLAESYLVTVALSPVDCEPE